MDKKYIPDQDAIDRIIGSIEHWNVDIVDLLKRGRTIMVLDSQLHWSCAGGRVKCTEGFCSLCQFYTDGGCRRCPLKLRHGISCNSPLSPWYKFASDPCLRTAEAMVKSLREALIPPGEGEIYELVERWVDAEMAAGKLSVLDLEDLHLAAVLQETADKAAGLEEYVASLATRVEQLERHTRSNAHHR